MEPRIQYAKTSDGVNIAYGVVGDGPPLVYVPAVPFPLIQMARGPWLDRMGTHRKIVTYDSRGSGLSERNVSEFSLDAFILDLEAVVDHLSIQPIALFAASHGAPIATEYAIRHPDHVSVWR